MTLKIKVTGSYAKSFKDNAEKEFTVHGGSMGRAVENDWVLPDPNRHISSKHAAILNKDGHYFILDTSTNGVFMNESKTRIGRGNSVRLQPNDTFRISDFVFQVYLENDGEASAQDKAPEDLSLKEKDEMVSFAALLEDDLTSGEPRISEEEAQRDRDFADEFLTETIAPDQVGKNPDDWEMMEMPEANISPASTPDNDTGLSMELLPPEEISQEFDGELSLAEEDVENLLIEDDGPNLELVADTSQSSIPVIEPVAAKPEPKIKQPAKAEPKAEAPAKPRNIQQPQRSARRSTSDSGRFSASHQGEPLEIFLHAAGLDASDAESLDEAQIMRNAGQLLREFVVGAMDTLATRSEIKNTLKVSETQIESDDYNPLRFSAGVNESLKSLLVEKGRRNTSPVDSVRKSFHDLRVHQLAMVEAMQESVENLFDRFDPVDLEERFDRGMKRGPLMGKTNKLKYWELFADLYNAMAEGRSEGLPHVFSDEFSRVYEAKVKELTKSRTNLGSKVKIG
jgi:type VI secretion system protein